jgi:hypothetical protein
MDGMQPACAQGTAERRAVDAGGLQLRPRHDSGLRARDSANHFGWCAVSGHKPNWFAHAAMFGTLPVPTQRVVRNDSAQEPPRLATHQHDAPDAMVIRLK